MEAEKYSSPFLKERLANMDPLLVKIASTRMRLVARIEDLLKERGWTKTEFIKRLGTSHNHLSRLMRTDCSMEIESLVQIAHAFDIEVRDLFPEASYFETKNENDGSK